MKKYEKIYELLLEEIENCINNNKFSLLPERQMAIKYDVSRQTIRHALNMLEKTGYIETLQGSGIYVTGRRPSMATTENSPFEARDNRDIAVIVYSDTEYEYPDYLSKLSSILQEKGFSYRVYCHKGSYQALRSILEELRLALPLALIIEPVNTLAPSINYDIFDFFKQARLPVLFLHECPPNLGAYSVVKYDYFTGAYNLCEFLIKHSHQKIGGIFKGDSLSGHEQYMGLTHCLIDKGLSLEDENVLWYDNPTLKNLEEKQDTFFIRNYLKNNLGNCSAVICQNDEIAYWLVKECQKENLSIPEDLNIVSCNNTYLATLSNPGITGLIPSETSLAKESAAAILGLLRNQPLTNVPIGHKIVERGTT